MTTLRDDARAIWQAGVNAVDSKRLVQNAISVDESVLTVAGESFDRSTIGRIVVVGAGRPARAWPKASRRHSERRCSIA